MPCGGFIGGKDVLVSLRTGYGKSLCFALLPRYDEKSGYSLLGKFYVNVFGGWVTRLTLAHLLKRG